MPALMGLNIAPDAQPAEVAATGATWLRCVWRDWLTSDWAQSYTSRGMELLLVGDSSPDSLGNDEARWAGRMTLARSNLGHLVKCWQWFNEPDGSGIASWTMEPLRLERGLIIAREVFPKGQYTLVFPGLVSGQAGWLDHVSYWLTDAIDAHPYAKFVDSPAARRELDYMLDGYKAKGLPLWLCEYDSRTAGLSAYLRDYPGVERAAVFCWDSKQTAGEGITGMGIKQNHTAMSYFVAATGGPLAGPTSPSVPPVSVQPRYVLGFELFHQAVPTLLGKPLENERGGIPGFSQQRTERGILTAANIADRGWELLFWESGTGDRYRFADGRAELIA